MTLGEKQELFARLHMLLLMHLHASGYSVREKYLLRCEDCPVGHPRSVHKSGLAIDIRLAISPVPGIRPKLLSRQAAEKAHAKAHDFWESIGGAKRIPGDLGPYSLAHQGMR